MLAFIATNRSGRLLNHSSVLVAVAASLLTLSIQGVLAQTGGGLGCVIDAGISPQEVCKGDYVQLGGNPTIPFNLSQEYASVTWSVVEGDSVTFDPSPEVPNPFVQVDNTTTFMVELVMNDGSVCSSTITLVPITEPMLDLQGSWTQCGGSTLLSFYNTSPSNSVAITYDVDWGDGDVDASLPFASAFEHDYATLGQYAVTVTATLGSCVNEETLDVFLGTPPEPILLEVPEWTCSGSEVSFEWSNLNDYPLGSSWQIQLDGSVAFSGAVSDTTSTAFEWSFGESLTCLDALATHSVYAQLSNACLPAANASASFNVIMEPEADIALSGDSCAFVQMTLSPEVVCPDLHSLQWNVSSEGESIDPSTHAGGPQSPFWSVELAPGEYVTTLEMSNPACGSSTDTTAFCIEMSPPADWATPGVSNGEQFNICVNEVVDLWIDPIESICGSDISGEWFVSPMTEDTDPDGFETLLNEEWHRTWSFPTPGIYLIELEGQIGCGDLDLFASVVVTELPEVTLTSYDNGVPDQVLCRGDEVSVVAEVSGVGLNSGAYDLNWSVLNATGQPHPSASASQYGDSTLIVQSHPSAPAEDIFVALEVLSACGLIHDTLHLEVEGSLPLNYSLVSGTEGPVNNGIPEFVQCQGDTLELAFEVPGAAIMNVYSQTFDLWNLSFDEEEGSGELTWLSNGLNWDFELEYWSAEGCHTLDTLSFRSIFRPEVFVDAPELVCHGDTSEFSAVVFPGSTSTYNEVIWSVGGSVVQTGLSTDFAYVMPNCLNNPAVTCSVMDEFGCQASAPSVTAPISCPPNTTAEFYSCGEEGDTLCQTWVESPVAGWLLDENMWIDNDSLGTCVVVDSTYVHHSLTWLTTTELGCQQTNHMCWGVGTLDSLGQCTEVPCSPPPPPPCDAFVCADSLACNYGLSSCCLDSCVFPETLGTNALAFDSLVFCQSWTPHLLEAQSPWIGNWFGDGVADNSQASCPGTQAYLDLSVPGEWDIYFHGGLGSCIEVDTVHVVVHEIPQYDGPGAFQACHGVELDLGEVMAQDASLCWSLDWLGEEPDGGCDTAAVWLVNGSGWVAWTATNDWGCSSLNTSIYIEDLGQPNAIVGGDTVLCNQAIPNIMTFEFGAPYALGCNPAQGVWEGQGANLEFFTEVWSNGNCLDAGDPWTDSLWTFTPDSVGVYEWVWTVTDCNGCVDRDTLNITVVEPTPPVLPQLTFCMDAPVGPVTTQSQACWIGNGISPDYIFDPVAAGEGTHEWVVRIGEGSCAMTDTVEVEIHDVPHMDLVGYGPWPCYGDAYAMCVETEDSLTDNWTYDWHSFPALLAIDSCSTSCCDVENVDATNATVTVTNEHGCSSEDSWIINLAPTPEVVLTDTLFFCMDGANHPIPTAPMGGTWTGEHLTETGVFAAEEVGVFVLHYEFINVQNCMDEDSIVVVVTDIPQPTIVTPQVEYCLGSPALLYADLDGVWSGPGIDGSGAIQQSNPGTYSYHFTTGSGSCLAQDSIDITFLELPFVDLPVDTILCPGSPLEIEVPEEAIDSLDLVYGFGFGCEGVGGEFPSYTFEPEFTCGFSLVVVDDHGCMGYDDMMVIVPLPTPSYAGPPEVMCMGEELQLEGQIVPGCATDVTWSGDLVDETGYVTADSVGVHWLELSYFDCFGCPASGQREILVLDAPILEAMWSDSVVCEGEEVDLSLEGYGGSLGFDWDWIDAPFPESPSFPWLAQNPLDSVLDLTLWVTAGNLCNADSVALDLSVWPAISAVPNEDVGSTPMLDTVMCAPVSLIYQANAAGALDWVWASSMTADSVDASVAEFSVDVVDQVMTFDLGVLASLNQTACTSPAQWSVTVVPQPIATVNAIEAHCGDSFNPEVQFNAQHGDMSWEWSGGELPPSFPEEWMLESWGTTNLTLTVTSTHPGVYCSATDDVSLSFYDQPVAGFDLISDSVVCAPGSFQIVDTSADAQSITWLVDYVGGALSPQDTLNLLLPQSGQFGLLWTAQGEGGCADTLFVPDVLEVLPSPEAGIWSNQPQVVPWRMDGTEFIFNDVSLGNNSTIWTVGDSTIVDQSMLQFSYEAPGEYAIGQQVFNNYGCQDTVSFRFEIVDELNIHVPTAFTPNGDFVNDVWKPVIAGVERIDEYMLRVMSRSGQVAFETSDPEEGWDALDVRRAERLEDVQNSVFRYVLRVLPNATPLEPDPTWMEYSGHVMIVD